jgi:hypothetical protein
MNALDRLLTLAHLAPPEPDPIRRRAMLAEMGRLVDLLAVG